MSGSMVGSVGLSLCQICWLVSITYSDLGEVDVLVVQLTLVRLHAI